MTESMDFDVDGDMDDLLDDIESDDEGSGDDDGDEKKLNRVSSQDAANAVIVSTKDSADKPRTGNMLGNNEKGFGTKRTNEADDEFGDIEAGAGRPGDIEMGGIGDGLSPAAAGAMSPAESMRFDDFDDILEDEADVALEQQTIDDAVMSLLHPDYFQITDRAMRREELRKHNAAVRNWTAAKIDRKIIKVADSISLVDRQPIVDMAILNEFHDAKKVAQFTLESIDLHEIKEIPRKYFDESDLGNESHARTKSYDDDYGALDLDAPSGIKNMANKAMGLGKLGIKMGIKSANAAGKMAGVTGDVEGQKTIVCSACGNLCRFKRKHKHKDFFMAFVCPATGKQYLFHDYLCVKLRKMKEALRQYAFNAEKDLNQAALATSKENLEAKFVSIDMDANMKRNKRARPAHHTTPRRGDNNYNETGDDDDDEEDADDDDDVRDEMDFRTTLRDEQKSGDASSTPIRNLGFRKYRTHVTMIADRMVSAKFMDPKKLIAMKERGEKPYGERFNMLPHVVLYADLNEFGVAIWEFISEALKSKQRECLWKVLEFLALEMGTNQVLDLLKRHTHLLSKHMLKEYDMIAKACIEGSRYPIATALRLAAFFQERSYVDLSNQLIFKKKSDAYVNIARNLLKEIENDHLFAMLVQLPTDIEQQSTIEIALRYELIYFLEEPRIVRVFAALWSGGYDFVRPDMSFQDQDLDLAGLYSRLFFQAGKFYWSPAGKFATSAVLYIIYLGIFSYVTLRLIYDYTVVFSLEEYLLWVCSFGYVMNEVVEWVDDPRKYFQSITNYWDVLIALNWMILGYLRWLNQDLNYQYDSTGEVNDTAMRNTKVTELYMAVWSMQSVLLWSRVVSLFQTTRGAGPLIRMIINMIRDIANFGLICVLFLIGFTFGAYFIIGGDLGDVPGVKLGRITSVGLYIFQTFLGQQTWEKVDSVKDDNGDYLFDPTRSNMVLSLMFLFSVIGTILLFNLLIAMMASTFENVRSKSATELNKERISKTYELDMSRSIIPPPMNVIAGFLYVYWMAFELIVYVLTFGHKQFNEEFFCPINKEAHKYRQGDQVTFKYGNDKLTGIVVHKSSIKDRLAVMSSLHDKEVESWDLRVEVDGDRAYDIRDRDVISLQKNMLKKRETRIFSSAIINEYCRYCRYNITNDRMSIEFYLRMFEERGQHIDPEDQAYMRDLLSRQDRWGVPNPQLCELCPNCYRPFKMINGRADSVMRALFILEIVSFMVFRMIVWPALLVALGPPANILRLTSWLSAKWAGEADEDARSRKSAMYRTESNDNYRAKVREASKQEETVDAVVTRIDGNVSKLENVLMGGRPRIDDDDTDGVGENGREATTLDRDEFDIRIDRMRAEMNRKFEEMKELLLRPPVLPRMQPTEMKTDLGDDMDE